jgi:regulation of enolase protein 1 (concanavalin A-like superfamily)
MTSSMSASTAVPGSRAAAAHRPSLPFRSVSETAPTWLNEPVRWCFEDGSLVVDVDPGTDFWRETHYGFVRDNGHLLAVLEPRDFVATVEVDADYRDRYDQAGLMVRSDAEHWLKAGIELDGTFHVSTVVTHGRSDWSVVPLADRPERLQLRVTRSGDALTVEYALGPADGEVVAWQLHRLAWFPPQVPVLVGPMAAAPDGSGFTARFSRWEIQR